MSPCFLGGAGCWKMLWLGKDSARAGPDGGNNHRHIHAPPPVVSALPRPTPGHQAQSRPRHTATAHRVHTAPRPPWCECHPPRAASTAAAPMLPRCCSTPARCRCRSRCLAPAHSRSPRRRRRPPRTSARPCTPLTAALGCLRCFRTMRRCTSMAVVVEAPGLGP